MSRLSAVGLDEACGVMAAGARTHPDGCPDRASGQELGVAAGARPALSRDLIATTALDLLDREGVAALTMRGLAARLGVAAPSLYNHVESLDEVIDLVQEAVNREIDHAGFASDDLREGLAQVAHSYRAAYLRHPNVLAHVVRRVMRAPTALGLYDGFATFLSRHGVRHGRVLTSMAMLDGLVLGSTLDAFHGGFTAADDYADAHPGLSAALGSADLAAVDDSAFVTALGVVLDTVASWAV